jgi:hypothetical protein
MKRSFLGVMLFAFFLVPTTSKAGTDVFLNFDLDVPSPVFVTPPTVAVPRGVISQPASVSIRSSGPEIKHKVKHKTDQDVMEYEEEFEDGHGIKRKVKHKTKPDEMEFEEEYEQNGRVIKHKVKRKIKDGKIEYEEEFEDGKHKIKYKTKPEGIEFEEEFE